VTIPEEEKEDDLLHLKEENHKFFNLVVPLGKKVLS